MYCDLPDDVLVAASPTHDQSARDYVRTTTQWLDRHVLEGSIVDRPFAVDHALWLGPTQEYSRHWLRGRAKLRPSGRQRSRNRCVGCTLSMTPRSVFIPYPRTSRYLELVGPVYQHREDPSVIGFELDERHTNSRGFCHAGVLVALADTVMGHTIEHAATVSGRPVTVTLTTDFIGTARTGDWLEGHAAVRRAGRRLAFGASRVPPSRPARLHGQRRVRRRLVTNRTIRRDIAEWVLGMPVAVALGFRFVHLDDGTCETHLAWRPALSHTPGAFQATPIGALADFTGASAAMSTQPTRAPAITVDYTIKLLAEARG